MRVLYQAAQCSPHGCSTISLSVIAMYLCFSHMDCVLVMKVVSHGLLFSQSGALEVVYRSCVTDVEKQRWRCCGHGSCFILVVLLCHKTAVVFCWLLYLVFVVLYSHCL
ncbi:hypothetical protein HID58_088349 [Brassica napus]|uniref:Uncharacterized protein n=1 Tax=Brassica napus TaxID=3708 RepID=A0ABQ7XVY6_BRANA|nr:hypothetical protein HID58_088349 [Brassica napus]